MGADDEAVQARETAGAFSIEQVAASTGLTKRTLRYYEEVGLLPPTERTEGNYRRYTQDDIQRLQRIKNLRDLLGFSLTDIRVILEAEDERLQIKVAFQQSTEASSKIAQLDHADTVIQRQLELIEQKIAGLEQMRAALLEKMEKHQQKRQILQQDRDP